MFLQGFSAPLGPKTWTRKVNRLGVRRAHIAAMAARAICLIRVVPSLGLRRGKHPAPDRRTGGVLSGCHHGAQQQQHRERGPSFHSSFLPAQHPRRTHGFHHPRALDHQQGKLSKPWCRFVHDVVTEPSDFREVTWITFSAAGPPARPDVFSRDSWDALSGSAPADRRQHRSHFTHVATRPRPPRVCRSPDQVFADRKQSGVG